MLSRLTDGDLAESARKLSHKHVAQLLEKMGLTECAENVKSNEFNGIVMYKYLLKPSVAENGMGDIGIGTRVDELRFCVQFKRALLEKETEHEFSPQKLGKFLIEKNFGQYAEVSNPICL